MFFDQNTLENVIKGIRDEMNGLNAGNPTWYVKVYSGTSATDPDAFDPSTHTAALLVTWNFTGAIWRQLSNLAALTLTYDPDRTAAASGGTATAPAWAAVYDSTDSGATVANYCVIGPCGSTNSTLTVRIWNETTDSATEPPPITSGDTIRLDEITFTLTDSLT